MGRKNAVIGVESGERQSNAGVSTCQPACPQALQFQMFTRILGEGRASRSPRHDRTMTTPSRAAIAVLLVCLAAGLPAQTRTFPVDELKPGMVATGRTVFEGDRLDEFKAHILGVLHNVIGPRR